MHDQSLTFKDLIMRVAERCGLAVYPEAADNRASIPTDPHDLDKVKRAINDGRAMLYADRPSGWRALRGPVTISMSATAGPGNVNGDTSRLRLPWSVTGPAGSPWIFSTLDASLGGKVQVTTPERVIEMLAHSTVTGPPRMACVVPIVGGDAGGVRQGWELRIWPRPDADYTLTGLPRRGFVPLVELAEREPLGSPHDMTIVDYAVWIMMQSSPDSAMRTAAEKAKEISRQRSMAWEDAGGPDTAGVLVDPTTEAGEPYRRVVLHSVSGIPMNT